MQDALFPLLAVLCLVMLSVSMLRRSQARRATSRDLTREQLARLRDQKAIQGSMEELLLQLEEVSRRVSAQVDTRFMKLDALIRDADNRIAKLEQLLGRKARPAERTEPAADNASAERPATKPAVRSTTPDRPDEGGFRPGLKSRATQPSPSPRGGAPTSKAPGASESDAPPRRRPAEPTMSDPISPGVPMVDGVDTVEFSSMAREGQPTSEPGSPSPTASGGAPASPTPSGEAPELANGAAGASDRRRRIYELADAGNTPITIADTLRIPLGEVELLLNLRDYK